jgi:hypothetical protein
LPCRGDDRDEVIKAAKEDAEAEILAWFKEHLKS